MAFDSVVLLLATLFLVLFAYVLGHSILTGAADRSVNAEQLRAANWLDHYLPDIPRWYPLEGGGLSFQTGSGVLVHSLLIILKRATGLALVQGYRLLGFSAPVLAAFGLLILGRWLSAHWTAGFLAGLLFLATPAAWTWIYEVGLLPQAVAFALMPFTIASFGCCLNQQTNRALVGSRRAWLAVTVLVFSAILLVELRVGMAAGAAMIVYLLVSAYSPAIKKQFVSPNRLTWALLLITALSLAVSAAILLPRVRDLRLAGVNLLGQAQDGALAIPSIAQTLGFSGIPAQFDGLRVQMPAPVVLMFAIGAVIALRTSRVALAVAAVGLFGLLGVIAAAPPTSLDNPSVNSGALLAPELWLPLLLLSLPAIAGLAAWAIAKGAIDLGLSALGTVSRVGPYRQMQNPLSGVATLALAICLLGLSAVLDGRYLAERDGYLAIGPGGRGVELADIWGRGSVGSHPSILSQLRIDKWPLPLLSSELPEDLGLAEYPQNAIVVASPRIGASPNLDPTYRLQTAQVNRLQLDAGSQHTPLLKSFGDYQRNVFYSREPGIDEHGNPISLNNTAQWYGTGLVLLSPTEDPTEVYWSAGWRPILRDTNVEAWEYPGELQLASLTNRPAILVTEREGRDSYANFFLLANAGLFPYDHALLIEGGRKLDDYTVEELQFFDALFLAAYDYGSRTAAWSMLEEYVRQGGSLFVETGWQYAVAEWEFETAPAVLPISRLEWTDYGMVGSYTLQTEDFAAGIDVGQFNPLIWEGQPWQLSGADTEDIRDWGRAVLSMDGRPLIVAGHYGDGRVVWSGMNLINHAQYLGRNEAELQLLRNIVLWLLAGKQGYEVPPSSMSRENPDLVELSFAQGLSGKSWLYWREAFHPNWRAQVVSAAGARELPIFRGGPGFMAVPLGTLSGDARVLLQWKPGFVDIAASVMSFLGSVVLVALIADGALLRGNGFTWLKIAMVMRIPQPFLGEGSNREWAERKRAELEAGQLASDTPPHLKPAQAIPWWRGDGAGEQAGQAADEHTGDGHSAQRTRQMPADGDDQRAEQAPAIEATSNEPVQAATIEPPSDEIEQALLKSWLNGSGHSDDAWAEKLLGRRKSIKED